nr:hypothetical protein [Saprospiraceae bacterium]
MSKLDGFQDAVEIRPGTRADLADVLDLVRELAVFEEAEHKVTATLQDYQDGFDAGTFAFLLASNDTEP